MNGNEIGYFKLLIDSIGESYIYRAADKYNFRNISIILIEVGRQSNSNPISHI